MILSILPGNIFTITQPVQPGVLDICVCSRLCLWRANSASRCCTVSAKAGVASSVTTVAMARCCILATFTNEDLAHASVAAGGGWGSGEMGLEKYITRCWMLICSCIIHQNKEQVLGVGFRGCMTGLWFVLIMGMIFNIFTTHNYYSSTITPHPITIAQPSTSPSTPHSPRSDTTSPAYLDTTPTTPTTKTPTTINNNSNSCCRINTQPCTFIMRNNNCTSTRRNMSKTNSGSSSTWLRMCWTRSKYRTWCAFFIFQLFLSWNTIADAAVYLCV